jgi:hypothetical protein
MEFADAFAPKPPAEPLLLVPPEALVLIPLSDPVSDAFTGCAASNPAIVNSDVATFPATFVALVLLLSFPLLFADSLTTHSWPVVFCQITRYILFMPHPDCYLRRLNFYFTP